MQIANDKVVIIDYTLTDDAGEVIDSCDDGSFAYLHGAQHIVPGLESALAGKQPGDEVQVAVAPEDAYGHRDDSRTQPVPREMFPEDGQIEVGMQFHAQGPDGHALVVTVAAVEEDTVVVDGNHPLAGVPLNFHVKVLDVRDATQEELSHGHVHGPGGHHH